MAHGATGTAYGIEGVGTVGGVADREGLGDRHGLDRLHGVPAILERRRDRRAAAGLGAEDLVRGALHQAQARQLAEALVDLGEQRPGRHRDDDLLGQPPAELLSHLVAQGLAALGVVGPHVDVDERPVLVLRDLAAQPVDIVVAAVDGDEGLAVDGGLHDLALFEITWDENDRAQPSAGGVGGDGVGEVAGRGAGDGGVAERAGGRQRHRHHPVLERVRRVAAVVFDPELSHAKCAGQVGGLAQLGHPGAEIDAGSEVLAGRQQPGVAPDRLRSGLDRGAGDEAQLVLVVGDLERGEALVTDVHRSQWDLVAALATGQRCGGAPGEGRRDGERGHASPHLPHAAGAGRSWHLARALVAGASLGRVPGAPRDERAVELCRHCSRWS